MENEEAKIDTITTNTEVLAIGEKRNKNKKEREKPEKIDERAKFKSDCLKRLSLLLMGSQTPFVGTEDTTKSSWIGIKRIKQLNKPDRFKFYYVRSKNRPDTELYSFRTQNPAAIMYGVRKLLKDENWISKYVIQSPLKVRKQYDNDESYYIQSIISEVIDVECNKISQFMHYLNFEHSKKSEKV
ncbi:uncharacterized protein LOC116804940 isoform X4 [Drosophila grimshawi]|uniref:uncharacterized protein LOC116804940 isoform X4 n=1 Tax=Drosophila grimshawi TaxID=7222 RepID=UPI000C870D24|nr:uncharacterized protein LOC116804940 isoform X4 [Drosophila grimshawi]